ncbi:thiamine kinase-like enzyme [Lipingzhangella halophila]|uniref:Thiamine kinase-like enzyme n=1 Tax=Lipingzhangella halophila TaxID=1783352 RepID=A0A7W7W3U0_9ACTN|nr:thiamine kinase-like enzyme [Lipingzhangella halophila]
MAAEWSAFLTDVQADRVDTTVQMWVCAHGDLHWNNVTAPGCVLLDWEGWGMAPLGYDAATLYCHSLLVPDVAARVREEFTDVLDTPDGVRSQLLVIARMLQRSVHGDYPALVALLHRLADDLLTRR